MEHYSAIKTECSVDRQHERVMKSEDVREASHGDHKWLDFFFSEPPRDCQPTTESRLGTARG